MKRSLKKKYQKYTLIFLCSVNYLGNSFWFGVCIFRTNICIYYGSRNKHTHRWRRKRRSTLTIECEWWRPCKAVHEWKQKKERNEKKYVSYINTTTVSNWLCITFMKIYTKQNMTKRKSWIKKTCMYVKGLKHNKHEKIPLCTELER